LQQHQPQQQQQQQQQHSDKVPSPRGLVTSPKLSDRCGISVPTFSLMMTNGASGKRNQGAMVACGSPIVEAMGHIPESCPPQLLYGIRGQAASGDWLLQSLPVQEAESLQEDRSRQTLTDQGGLAAGVITGYAVDCPASRSSGILHPRDTYHTMARSLPTGRHVVHVNYPLNNSWRRLLYLVRRDQEND
ncbi:unnamed protein product, partial [Protopolystoma xenopodis]